MSDLGLDFGLLIAYFVPGALALIGLTYFSATAREIVKALTGHDRSPGGFLVATVVALVLGMSISILRAGTVDVSFGYQVPGFAPPIEPQGIRYENLTSEGRLAAYLEAKASDKRPYQFYGNTLLALVLVATGILLGGPYKPNQRRLYALGILIVALAVLYPAARLSHFRFMETVSAFNKLPPCGLGPPARP